ncbi:MAG: 4Fe-4S double cluster binding domain-containing protein [Clostridia bacterium]
MDKNGEEELKQRFHDFAFAQGATLFGVADLLPAKNYILEEFGSEYLKYHRAIAIGMPFPNQIIEQLLEGPTHTYLYYYNVLNQILDNIAIRIAIQLEELGFSAFPIPASQRTGDSRLSSIFSHRLAANLAGLGWIGKNAALVSPQYGPRLRLVTILTNCEFEVNNALENHCGSCQICIEACPAKAITGVSFEENKSLTARFIATNCDEFLTKMRNTFGKRICGRCQACCPWGK